jgi:aquaporin NIP
MNVSPIRQLRPLVAEFIGTFALVFIGCGAIATGKLDPLAGAVAFGGTLGIMVYALGHVSGGHFNPAVTIGLAVGRRFGWIRVPAYIIAQAVGATAAALLLRLTLNSGVSLGVNHPTGSDGQSFVWEIVLTFFLVLVVTAVATDARAVRSASGLCIGGTVVLDALVGGPISGASMNPARSFGPALVAGDFSGLWIYLLAPVIGGVIAALIYSFLRDEKKAWSKPVQSAGRTSPTTPPSAGAANQRTLRRIAVHTSASITGTSISGPTTVARATVGENAVIAMAMAISKSRPVELKATATASR